MESSSHEKKSFLLFNASGSLKAAHKHIDDTTCFLKTVAGLGQLSLGKYESTYRMDWKCNLDFDKT